MVAAASEVIDVESMDLTSDPVISASTLPSADRLAFVQSLLLHSVSVTTSVMTFFIVT